MLDFLNVKFVTVRTAKRVELCVTVPNFVKIAETAGRMSNCVTVSNFVEIARTAAEICEFSLKLLIHAPFGEVFGAHFPRMMSHIVRTTKGPSFG